MSELIDTTEMYLRTVYELLEEGVAPLRARIAERLHQSGPTVSQTVARMERDGLLHVLGDRQIRLSRRGMALAQGVMRKHRVAERLLLDVVGLEWPRVHEEACRWEHVISDDVELKMISVLGSPTHSPFGNPIPSLAPMGADALRMRFADGVSSFADLAPASTGSVGVELVRIGEAGQSDVEALTELDRAGLRPGGTAVLRRGRFGVLAEVARGGRLEISDELAQHLYGRPC